MPTSGGKQAKWQVQRPEGRRGWEEVDMAGAEDTGRKARDWSKKAVWRSARLDFTSCVSQPMGH